MVEVAGQRDSALEERAWAFAERVELAAEKDHALQEQAAAAADHARLMHQSDLEKQVSCRCCSRAVLSLLLSCCAVTAGALVLALLLSCCVVTAALAVGPEGSECPRNWWKPTRGSLSKRVRIYPLPS